jgi:squalene synthase HpnC
VLVSVESPKFEATTHTLDEAFAYCAAITNAHYENFPVASLFLPQEKRPYIQAIYAFSRVADDFADEFDRTPEERLSRLIEWEARLQSVYERPTDPADHPIFEALRETVKRNNIPIDPLRDLLTAFKRDVLQNRYETFSDLLSYCALSANPVGRLVLMIFGHREDALFKMSDSVCTALQLANFWQDIEVDLTKDRLYLPMDEMNRFGYTLDKWRNRIVDDSFRELMKLQVARTREFFYRGAPLPALVEKELQVELRLVWFGGMSILRKTELVKFDVFRNRPTLGAFDKVMVLARGLFYRNLELFGKPRPKKKPWDLT